MAVRRNTKESIIGTLPLVVVSIILLTVQIFGVIRTQTVTIPEIIVSPLFYLLCGIGASVICKTLGFIKNNSILPIFITLLLSGTLGVCNGWWEGFVCSLLIFLSWFIIITLPKEENTVWNIFTVMFLLAIASFININTILVIPVILYGIHTYNKLDFRGIVASLLGFGAFYALLFPSAFLLGYHDALMRYTDNNTLTFQIIQLRIADIIAYITLGLYTIIAFSSFITHFHDNKIYVRSTYLFSYLLLFSEILICVFTSNRNTMEPVIITLLGILLSIYASNNITRFKQILFYTTILLLLITSIGKYFIL